MDKGFFSDFVNICCGVKGKKKTKHQRDASFLSQCCNFLCWWFCVHAFMVSVAKVEGNLQYLRPLYSERVIGHCTKEFHLFLGLLLLIWATRSGMKKGWQRRAPQPQHCRQLTASCYSLFRNSWSFLKCLLSFWKLDCSIYSNCVFSLHWIFIFFRLAVSYIKFNKTWDAYTS